MIGLVYLLFFALYLLLCAYVVYRATLYARHKYSKGWLGGWLAAFVMYNLVFWDWIPVYVMHKYYCAADSGFWVYKTPEQWFKENPEAKGRLWGDDYRSSTGARQREYFDGGWSYQISDYLAAEIVELEVFHAIWRQERKLKDVRSGEILAHIVDYYRGSTGLAGGASSLVDYKIWLAAGRRDCTSKDQEWSHRFIEFKDRFIRIGGEVK